MLLFGHFFESSCDLAQEFKSKEKHHCIVARNIIFERLKNSDENDIAVICIDIIDDRTPSVWSEVRLLCKGEIFRIKTFT